MSGLCKDCKWWVESYSVPIGLGEWKTCQLTQNEGMEEFTHPDSLALSMGTGFSSTGALATAPDFGCNQFEAK